MILGSCVNSGLDQWSSPPVGGGKIARRLILSERYKPTFPLFFPPLCRSFRLFRAWAAQDSHPPAAANQTFSPPLPRTPSSQISPPYPSWVWSHGAMWREMTRKRRRRRRIPHTRIWIVTRRAVWTPGPGPLWVVITLSGKAIVGHRGTFSSLGESWILTRSRETEHYIGDFQKLFMDCCWNLLDTEDVLRDACCGRESGDSFCSFWKGELVLECGIDQGSFTLVMDGLLIAHLPSTFLLSESKGMTFLWMFSITQEQESEGQP